MDMSLSKLRDIVKDREAWGAVVNGVVKSWTRLNNNTYIHIHIYSFTINLVAFSQQKFITSLTLFFDTFTSLIGIHLNSSKPFEMDSDSVQTR